MSSPIGRPFTEGQGHGGGGAIFPHKKVRGRQLRGRSWGLALCTLGGSEGQGYRGDALVTRRAHDLELGSRSLDAFEAANHGVRALLGENQTADRESEGGGLVGPFPTLRIPADHHLILKGGENKRQDRPLILIHHVDLHQHRLVGFVPVRSYRTPNLKRLGGDGKLFRQKYADPPSFDMQCSVRHLCGLGKDEVFDVSHSLIPFFSLPPNPL